MYVLVIYLYMKNNNKSMRKQSLVAKHTFIYMGSLDKETVKHIQPLSGVYMKHDKWNVAWPQIHCSFGNCSSARHKWWISQKVLDKFYLWDRQVNQVLTMLHQYPNSHEQKNQPENSKVCLLSTLEIYKMFIIHSYKSRCNV